MDNFPQLRKLCKRIMLSGYGIIAILWLIVTGFVGYDYTLSLFEVESTKGGTFVEAITEPLSFLPYRGDPEKNHFFQTLLFRGCTTPGSEMNMSGDQKKDLCQIITLSPREYEIRINTGFLWSDDKAMSIDDVFFTYQHIIKENKRQQTYLQAYQNIQITGKNDQSFRIVFPSEVPNHTFFFGLPILPVHILSSVDLVDVYTDIFSRKPVTSTCVTLDASTNDSSSLVFDMSRCQDNSINYYQLKSFDNSMALKTYLESNAGKKFLSLIPGQNDIPGYRLLPVYDDSFMVMFFNTQSSRLTPRIQRAIAGHIYSSFRDEKHEGYLGQYTGIVNTFQSNGENVASYIKEKNPRLSYDKRGLEQAGVTPLPMSINIDNINNKKAFFLEAQSGSSYTFSLITAQEMAYIQGQSDKSKKTLTISSDSTKKNHSITITIGTDQQIQEGVNTITIKGKDNKIIDIDIYYLGQTSENAPTTQTKLTLIYYKDTLSDYIVTQLQSSFTDAGLDDLINIAGYSDLNMYREALNNKDYDIVLSPLRMSSPRDIATLLSTNDPSINPSLLVDPSLSNLFVQYASSSSKNTENQIRTMIGTEMPFFVLGQHNYAYYIRDDIAFGYTGTLSLASLRRELLHHISLVSHMSVRAGKLIERKSILSYIRQQKHITQPALTPDSDDIDAIDVTTGNESLLSGN